MLQIDHIYEFFYNVVFKNFELHSCPNGVVDTTKDISVKDISIFTTGLHTTKKIFFYDQEPLLPGISDRYLDVFNFPGDLTWEEIVVLVNSNSIPYGYPTMTYNEAEELRLHSDRLYKEKVIVTSEKSTLFDLLSKKYNAKQLYYFFHGFAALDWYRGYYSLNYSKPVVREYKNDFISYNRIIASDRSYRIYFVSKLIEKQLLANGLISFGVTDDSFCWQDELADSNTKLSPMAKQHIQQYLPQIQNRLVIDKKSVAGSSSANILRTIECEPFNKTVINVDSFWHVVTETVFYYDKLHLTEKIFKPIVSKQPFMLLAAPGNLAYLKSYGFKTFEGIIDESYDSIQDNDQRTEAVVAQIAWYCALTAEEKQTVIEAIAPIVEYNFHHFYGEFKHIITRELLDNTQTLFKEIGYNDTAIAYDDIFKTLVN